MDLDGKVAVVTGSTRGIGAATARIFAQEGARVVVTGRAAELGRRVAEEIVAGGGDAIFQPADMGKESEVAALLDAAVARYGKVDVLVNNHAPVAEMIDDGRDRPLAELRSEDWDYILHHALTSFYYSIKHALPVMIANGGGSIVNISALASTLATPGLSTYSVAKGGINAMTRQVAADYGRHGIRINTILVGTIISNARMEAAWSHPRLREETIKATLVNRLGKPEDIAFAAVYLASDKSGYVTASELTVDGGIAVKLALPSLDEGWDTATRSMPEKGAS